MNDGGRNRDALLRRRMARRARKPRSHTLSAAVALVMVALLMAACRPGSSARSSDQATPTPLPTPIVPEKPVYTVELGTVVETLQFTGRASSLREQELFFETDGNIGEVMVSRGDWVEEGDTLIELDIEDDEEELEQKLLSLEIAQLKFEQTEIEATEAITDAQEAVADAEQAIEDAKVSSANAIAKARASVQSAQSSLESAQLNLTVVQKSDTVNKNVTEAENRRNWYEANYGEYLKKYEHSQCSEDRLAKEWEALMEAKADLESAYLQRTIALSNAEESVTKAQESLRQARADLAESLKETGVTDAEEALERAQEEYEDAVEAADADSYEFKLLTLELDQARLDIEDLRDHIAAGRLVAPFNGRILSLSVEAGDSVQAFDTIGVLADPSELEITAELGSDELSEMALDQAAVIALRNRPGETFDGTVVQLPYPYGGTTVDTDDDDTAVHISIEGDVDLDLGELATVSIVLQEIEDALWLPPGAIRSYQGRDFVVIKQDDGTQRRADVLIGIATDLRVEIVAGVKEGQVIIGE